MSTSPEAKQAAESIAEEADRRGALDVRAMAEIIDAATAKLGEEHAKDIRAAYDQGYADGKEQLAHQQPSPPSDGLAVESTPTPDVPQDFIDGMQDITAGRVVDLNTALTKPYPLTPDVEKIAEGLFDDLYDLYEKHFNGDDQYHEIKARNLIALAQARASLVAEFALAAESAYQLCLMIEEIPSSIPQTAASVFAACLRKKLADAAALTGTGEHGQGR